MAYTKTNWVDNVTPLSAANMNKIENELAKVDPMTTAGDIIYGGTSGTPTRLAKGTAGKVLMMNTGATAPEWGNAPQEWSPIQTVTVANATTQQVDFTSISTTYNELKLEILGTATAGNDDLAIRFNGNTSAIYNYNTFYKSSTTIADAEATGQTFFTFVGGVVSRNGNYLVKMHINNIASGNKVFNIIGSGEGTYGSIVNGTGKFANTSQITSISLRVSDFTGTTYYFGNGTIFRLYGKV